ncbi:diguanylate cyclase [Psychromonas sp. KJ10-10]|uniref:sensor domain-containing diguanylate cyclase n=1 Tax=Psychromonas sp. KJ10-10 TaxID=3391823 RepID=UPI0039B5FD15
MKKTYLLITLSLLFSPPLSLVFSYTIPILKKKIAEEHTTLTSLLISEWIKGAFNASDYILRDIIDHVPASALTYPATDPIEHARISELIDKKRQTLPYSNGVGLNDDKCIMTHTPSIIGFDASEREWCYVPMQNPELDTYVSNMFMSNIGEMMVIQVRKFPDNKGLIGLGVNLNFFSQWVKKVNIGQHGVVAIIDNDFKLLARQPEITDTLGEKSGAPIIEKFMISERENQSFSYISPLDNKQRLYSIRKIDNLPFVIIVGEAHSDWLSSWYKQLAISILLTCLFWIMGWLILRHYIHIIEQKKELEKASITDQLTGLYNRHKLNKTLQKEFHRAQRMQETFEVILMDIDNFKRINDTYGHNVGDKVLEELALLMKQSIRLSDTLGRWGGEEFLIIIPIKTFKAQSTIADKLRIKIEQYDFTTVKNITASFGVAYYKEGDSIKSLIKRADDALYQVKQNGRNQVAFEDVRPSLI